MRKQPGLLLTVLVCCLLLAGAGCSAPVSGASAASQAQPAAPEATRFTYLHTPMVGAGKDGFAPDGMYILQHTPNGKGDILIQYVDYASGRMQPLCANAACAHGDESCTAWFPGAYGTGTTWVLNDKVYLIFSGSETESGETVFPQLLQMDASGSNRTQLASFSADTLFLGGVATDGQNAYITTKSFEENSFKTSTVLLKLNLETGETTALQSWDVDVWIVSGCEGYLILMEPENFDTHGYGEYQKGKGVSYRLVGMDAAGAFRTLATVTEDGATGCVRGESYYSIQLETGAVTRKSLITGETKTLGALPTGIVWLSMDNLLGNMLLVRTAVAGVEKNDGNAQYAIDVSTGEITQVDLTIHDPNLPTNGNSIYVLAQWKEQYLAVNRVEAQQVFYLDETGTRSSINVMASAFALIGKEDFLRSAPNYTNIVSG